MYNKKNENDGYELETGKKAKKLETESDEEEEEESSEEESSEEESSEEESSEEESSSEESSSEEESEEESSSEEEEESKLSSKETQIKPVTLQTDKPPIKKICVQKSSINNQYFTNRAQIFIKNLEKNEDKTKSPLISQEYLSRYNAFDKKGITVFTKITQKLNKKNKSQDSKNIYKELTDDHHIKKYNKPNSLTKTNFVSRQLELKAKKDYKDFKSNLVMKTEENEEKKLKNVETKLEQKNSEIIKNFIDKTKKYDEEQKKKKDILLTKQKEREMSELKEKPSINKNSSEIAKKRIRMLEKSEKIENISLKNLAEDIEKTNRIVEKINRIESLTKNNQMYLNKDHEPQIVNIKGVKGTKALMEMINSHISSYENILNNEDDHKGTRNLAKNRSMRFFAAKQEKKLTGKETQSLTKSLILKGNTIEDKKNKLRDSYHKELCSKKTFNDHSESLLCEKFLNEVVTLYFKCFPFLERFGKKVFTEKNHKIIYQELVHSNQLTKHELNAIRLSDCEILNLGITNNDLEFMLQKLGYLEQNKESQENKENLKTKENIKRTFSNSLLKSKTMDFSTPNLKRNFSNMSNRSGNLKQTGMTIKNKTRSIYDILSSKLGFISLNGIIVFLAIIEGFYRGELEEKVLSPEQKKLKKITKQKKTKKDERKNNYLLKVFSSFTMDHYFISESLVEGLKGNYSYLKENKVLYDMNKKLQLKSAILNIKYKDELNKTQISNFNFSNNTINQSNSNFNSNLINSNNSYSSNLHMRVTSQKKLNIMNDIKKQNTEKENQFLSECTFQPNKSFKANESSGNGNIIIINQVINRLYSTDIGKVKNKNLLETKKEEFKINLPSKKEYLSKFINNPSSTKSKSKRQEPLPSKEFIFGLEPKTNKATLDDIIKQSKKHGTFTKLDLKPIFTIDIRIDDEKTEKLEFLKLEDPKERVEKFCRKHGLNSFKKELIMQIVKEKVIPKVK